MTCGKNHYKQNIYENTYATFYVATNTAMLEYPFIVGRYDESTPTLVEKAQEYILDSAIGDETIGNEDVLDRADDIGASVVVAADVLHEPHVTTERIVEMLKLVAERDRDYEVLIPLQYDEDTTHEDHYETVVRTLLEHEYDPTQFRYYVGGIAEKQAIEQIDRVLSLRECVGLDTYLHGLGMGATREWVVTIRQCPWVLDSFDNSSLVKNLIYSGKMWTKDGDWISFDRPRGPNSTVICTQYIESSLDLFNYMISSHVDERDALSSFENPQSKIAQRVQQHREWYQSQSSGAWADILPA